MKKYKNYRYYDRNFKPGDLVYYRLLPKQQKYKHTKGFLSIYPAKIICRIGNSFKIQLKGTMDDFFPDVAEDQLNENSDSFNGSIITVPARDLIPANKVQYNRPSKYNIQEALEKERQAWLSNIPGGHDYEWLVHKVVGDDRPLDENDWEVGDDSEVEVKQEKKPKHKRKTVQIFTDDDPLDEPIMPDVVAPAMNDDEVIPQPPPQKKTSHGITGFVPPPPVSGLMQLPYEQFAQAARPLDYNDVDDLLRTQQAFVDGTVAAAPPAPPLHVPTKTVQSAAEPKTKKQPLPRMTEVQKLKNINHRMKTTTFKRTRKPNQKYINDFI